MRSIGQLDSQKLATRFGDFLFLQGIENQVDSEDDGTFSIWVHDDLQAQPAADHLARFRAQPDAPEFARSSGAAQKKRDLETRAENNRRSTIADTARVGYEQHFGGFAWLPTVLIVACVAAAIFTSLGTDDRAMAPFFIALVPRRIEWLPEVRTGQIWRLVTPVFIHSGWLHLIFNMLWLRDLGTFVQTRFGAGYLAVLLLISAVVSNLGQYFWAGPFFGGMSGVNYALFGFLWLRGKYDRGAAWQLNPATVQMMLLWFVLCLAKIVPGVANGAHFFGLAAGAAWGFLSSGRLRLSR